MTIPGAGDVAVLALDQTDSTNAEAMRQAAAGARSPLWITARRQTAGRGRSGRAWGTPEGNVAATLLVFPECPPAALPNLSLVAGIAAFDAVVPCLSTKSARAGPPFLRLKWPNDLIVGDAKLAGILIESSALAGTTAVVIGTGINVAVAPPVAGRSVTCLASLGASASAGEVEQALLVQLCRWLSVWNGGAGFAAIRAAWLERAGPVGEAISVNRGSDRLAGTFAGLDEDGALLLATADGVTVRVTFGDVTLGASPAPV
jgi:BirA family transcriptional regulator, biotin operon repressor / biotin---[acetyl-CoA-carboxylase] ligase